MERVRGLPCWEGKEVKVRPVKELVEDLQLGEGRTNENFLVDAVDAGRRFFVRLGKDLPFYGVSRAREQSAVRAAHAAGLGPAVRYGEADVMVVDFVEGSRALTEDDLRSGDLTALGDVLRRLHACPVPPELEAFGKEMAGGWGGPHFEKWLRYAEVRGWIKKVGFGA